MSSIATGGQNSFFGNQYTEDGGCEVCASHSEFVGYAKSAIDQAQVVPLPPPARILLLHDIRADDEENIGTIIDEIEAYADSKNVTVYFIRVKDLEALGY